MGTKSVYYNSPVVHTFTFGRVGFIVDDAVL